jgi:hypothetical protein
VPLPRAEERGVDVGTVSSTCADAGKIETVGGEHVGVAVDAGDRTEGKGVGPGGDKHR